MVAHLQKPRALEHIPRGFQTFSTNCGIRNQSLDLGVVFSEHVCCSAAFFTQNQIQGEPVKVGKKHYKTNQFQALVVNSKNSNVYTGKSGYANCLKICQKVATELGIPLHSVFPSSTGSIGVPLPVGKICSALDELPQKWDPAPDFENFARSIMTTDTFPKYVSEKIGEAKIVGVTKGSGMIEPNMATTLSYFFTDADISSALLKKLTRPVLDRTFNSLSVDSDMSTSDTVLIMANGLAGEPSQNEFVNVFEKMSTQMTRWLAYDGEGASKLFVVDVHGANNEKEARAVGKSIINSPLVKTAIYKGDPNWGRIYMAIGKTPDVKLSPEKISLLWGTGSKKLDSRDAQALANYLRENQEIHLSVDLGTGRGGWRVYGCDLTEEYVRINAHYTT